MLRWFRDRKRKELLETPFPEEWLHYLQKNFPYYALLSPKEQETLRNDLRIFLAEKNWEGCAGLEMTEEIQVTISAEACLLTLGLEHDYYPNVESILVYPSGYVAREQRAQPGGVVVEGHSARLGEAWLYGPVVLSWDSVRSDGRNSNDGHNVVLHEFAHKLDMAAGRADGVPRLHDDAEYDRWAEVMSAEYQALVANSTEGHATLLNSYGATNAGEFFAVATECFFEKPRQMQRTHTALYEVLRDYYRQDPAARLEALHPHQEPEEANSESLSASTGS